ncbi:MAG: hypothetical protein ACKVOJ_08410 [Sphingomonadaceae bacterium]
MIANYAERQKIAMMYWLKWRAGLGLSAAVLLCGTSPSAAQAQIEPAGSCELHIWPSAGLRSIFSGWFHGGIVDGAVKNREGYPPVPGAVLSTDAQVALLTKIDFASLFNMPPHKQMVYAAPLATPSAAAINTRQIASPSPCYAEVMVKDVFYQEDIVSGRYLKMQIRFRNFGNGESPQRSFTTWVQSRLTLFPPKTSGQEANAITEVGNAYIENMKIFAKFLTRPPKK